MEIPTLNMRYLLYIQINNLLDTKIQNLIHHLFSHHPDWRRPTSPSNYPHITPQSSALSLSHSQLPASTPRKHQISIAIRPTRITPRTYVQTSEQRLPPLSDFGVTAIFAPTTAHRPIIGVEPPMGAEKAAPHTHSYYVDLFRRTDGPPRRNQPPSTHTHTSISSH